MNTNLLVKEEEKAVAAMSDIFLFEGLQNDDYHRIAKELLATGLTCSELDALFRNDVAFLLFRNPTVITGVWGGFDEGYLIAEINERRQKRRNSAWIRFLDGLLIPFRVKSYEDDWRRIYREIEEGKP